jgi:hypothetical protein
MRLFYFLFVLFLSSSLFAQTDADALAKQLQNPIANLISLPIQGNFNFGVGPEDGSRMILNIQPVIPFSISEDWNLVTRTIVPIISQNDAHRDSGSQFGLGDIVATAFFASYFLTYTHVSDTEISADHCIDLCCGQQPRTGSIRRERHRWRTDHRHRYH